MTSPFLHPSSADSTPRTSRTSSESGLPVLEDLTKQFHILKDLGTGSYARCILVQCRTTDQRVALKLVRKSGSKFREFIREFNFNHFLSPHPAIISTYRVTFETSRFYGFAMEHAPLGDLFDAISATKGLDPTCVRSAVAQVASALEFMHSKRLVHRDVKPENVLVFDRQCSTVKLGDFGKTREVGLAVRKQQSSRHLETPYAPPEIAQAAWQETYIVDPSHDVWSLGVLTFSALMGTFPWEMARLSDINYQEFVSYQKHKMLHRPTAFRPFSHRLFRLLRRMLEPKSRQRCPVKEVSKYLNDPWLLEEKPRSSSSPRHKLSGSFEVSRSQGNSSTGHIGSDNTKKNSFGLEEFGVDTKYPRSERLNRIRTWVISGQDDTEKETLKQLRGVSLGGDKDEAVLRSIAAIPHSVSGNF